MKVDGVHYRTIWAEGHTVRAIDQTRLPHEFSVMEVPSLQAAAHAIKTMQVRGAPLIGAAAAYGVALATLEDPSEMGLARARRILLATRPTAVNLRWALDRVLERLATVSPQDRVEVAFQEAQSIADDDVAMNRAIGGHALEILRTLAPSRGPLNVLTHCNAGWLATVDWGTATAGIYMAHDEGLPIHVFVDETRPRSQGGRLTAWELGKHGVPHTVIPDTAAGHLMARGDVDAVFVGTDRTTAAGEVANKIGTYPLALAARDNGVPFFVAAPSPSIDWTIRFAGDIPIEERSPDEVASVRGLNSHGEVESVRVIPESSRAVNYAFDVTPARLVTGLITERGVVRTSDGDLETGLRDLFPR